MESQLEKCPPIPLRLAAAGIPRWLAIAFIALATLAPAQLTWLHGLADHQPVVPCDVSHSLPHHDHDDHERSPHHCLICTQLLALVASIAPPPPVAGPATPSLATPAPGPLAHTHDSIAIHTDRARGPPPTRSARIPA